MIVNTLPHQNLVSFKCGINDGLMLADILGQKTKVSIRDNQLLAKLGIGQQVHALENIGLTGRDQGLVGGREPGSQEPDVGVDQRLESEKVRELEGET